jgi:ABC-type polysaccharide/polyol phosphate export permease
MSESSKRRWWRSSLIQLTLVRYREFWREPEAVFWVVIFPLLLAAGLGLAFRNRPLDVLPVGVVRAAGVSDRLQQALRADSTRLSPRLMDDTAAMRALRSGELALVVASGSDGAVQYRYDATREEGRAARLLVDDAIQRAAGRADPVGTGEQLIRDPGARYIDFVVPGLLGMNLMGSGIWGLGFAIVDARKRKVLKRLSATPMSRVEFLSSFLLYRLTILVIEVVTLVTFAALVFGVPLRGSLLELGAICLVASFTFGALGLLVASRARTMEGVSGLTNLVMLPMWIFSGVFFSASNFPAAIQPLVQALPLTAVNDALRANMLQGANLTRLGGELGIMAVWMLVSFLLALRLFRWK